MATITVSQSLSDVPKSWMPIPDAEEKEFPEFRKGVGDSDKHFRS